MKTISAVLLVACFCAQAAVAEDLAPLDPVTATRGFDAAGPTTTLMIIAGVIALGLLVSGKVQTGGN